ncbi:pleckstrin homology domain-containing family N member 1 isoform X1 [Takifugu rubripes]|uniref:Pleckstrin homology domain-containing family N member 1-like n=1 Tax=Takifugu rubripes TaxID=31033 RepID=A0A674NEV6_TAKRU|nr:pleckstrin homology domain-containing family N member 1-like isoform X1 [Takifugu rubripes]
MGCCSVTQRHTGVDEVGPDEIELLELSGDNLGVWSLAETRCPQVSVRKGREEQRPPLPPPPPPPPRCASVKHLGKEVVLWGRSKDELHQRIYSQTPPRNWEGQAPHMYGEIIHSSLVLLYNSHTQGSHEHFLVLFSFHLLILSLDHSKQDFIYEGILPLSGLSFQPVSLDHSVSHSPHVFETSSPMMESKVFICPSAAELQQWLQHLKDRRYKSMTRPMSPSQCALSYLLPCDEHWKREELKTYLMQAPIWQWEGSPIQHMGQPGYLSMVHIINTQNQGLQERLMVLFPHDVLLLSIDSKVLNIRYEGRLPRHSIKAVERSALPGKMEFELIGELVEPLLISCAHQEDYWSWIFQLQQPDRNSHVTVSHAAPPLVPKLQRSKKESQEPIIL